ncbi:Phosphatidylinositol (PI) 3-kinase [Sorochytrium milnesiophthora]
MDDLIRDYSYSLSSDVAVGVTLRLASLQGFLKRPPLRALLKDDFLKYAGSVCNAQPEYYATVQLLVDEHVDVSVQRTKFSACKSSQSGLCTWTWDEWIRFPIKIQDLTIHSKVVVKVWDVYRPKLHQCVGQCELLLLQSDGALKTGKYKLVLLQTDADSDTNKPPPESTEMERIEKMLKSYERGDVPTCDWLDQLAFREIEKLNKTEMESNKSMYLHFELPRFDFPIIYNERDSLILAPTDVMQHPLYTGALPASANVQRTQTGTLPYAPSLTHVSLQSPSTPLQSSQLTSAPAAAAQYPGYLYQDSQAASGNLPPLYPSAAPLCSNLFDPELWRDNIVEAKHRKLARSHRNGPLDRNLKPNAKIRDELNHIIKYPPTHPLSPEEKDLLWKFRFYLSRDRKALTKFLKCVVWNDPVEAKQAVDILQQNSWADIDVDDALELLGPEFENRSVRRFAVNQLQKADDEDLQLYLLQLVQALKFEGLGDAKIAATYIQGSNLAEFLIQRAAANSALGNLFYWYLKVEKSDKVHAPMYENVMRKFQDAVNEAEREVFARQDELVEKLATISKELQVSKDARLKKVERLQSIIADPKNGLAAFAPLPLPLDSRILVTGIVAEKASIFKSNLMPLRLTFTVVGGGEYPIIFKCGDDLRQDQLVIQIITLMDRLLQKERLDLRLTPYKVLATGVDQGMAQFIPSLPLATILAESNSIQSFLRKHNMDDTPAATFGISPSTMDIWVRSCAGYCVITYILGVGDRHLDNLLLTPRGCLFHVDFGYILGHDPKPFPPPMKLCKEMVEAMGGAQSIHYGRFKSYCYTAFSILRKSSGLILNLFNLMVDANIPDITMEPDKAVMKVQEKLRLDMSEEEASQYLQALINDSVSAMFPQVIETIHKWAQYWRK